MCVIGLIGLIFVASGEGRDVEVVDLGSEKQEVCIAVSRSRSPLTAYLQGPRIGSWFSEASVMLW
jgi:hypothetical protein